MNNAAARWFPGQLFFNVAISNVEMPWIKEPTALVVIGTIQLANY